MHGFGLVLPLGRLRRRRRLRCGAGRAQSRRHWLSARVYKRQLLLGYMVFNSALYGGQLVLYTLLFLPSFNQASKRPPRLLFF